MLMAPCFVSYAVVPALASGHCSSANHAPPRLATEEIMVRLCTTLTFYIYAKLKRDAVGLWKFLLCKFVNYDFLRNQAPYIVGFSEVSLMPPGHCD